MGERGNLVDKMRLEGVFQALGLRDVFIRWTEDGWLSEVA
jgi:hypothetical protein